LPATSVARMTSGWITVVPAAASRSFSPSG
jgi:hypothetical protein